LNAHVRTSLKAKSPKKSPKRSIPANLYQRTSEQNKGNRSQILFACGFSKITDSSRIHPVLQNPHKIGAYSKIFKIILVL